MHNLPLMRMVRPPHPSTGNSVSIDISTCIVRIKVQTFERLIEPRMLCFCAQIPNPQTHSPRRDDEFAQLFGHRAAGML